MIFRLFIFMIDKSEMIVKSQHNDSLITHIGTEAYTYCVSIYKLSFFIVLSTYKILWPLTYANVLNGGSNGSNDQGQIQEFLNEGGDKNLEAGALS